MANGSTQSLVNLRRRLQGKAARTRPHERVGSYALDNFDRQAKLAAAICELERLFWSHDGHLVHKWPHYLLIHQRYLEPLGRNFRVPTAAGGRVDDMHGWYHVGRIDRPMAKTDVSAITFQDGIVVIEKRQRSRPVHAMLGQRPF
jgi:hypothetical protein